MQDPQGQESQLLRLKIVPTQGEDHQDELCLPMTIVIQQTAALLKSLCKDFFIHKFSVRFCLAWRLLRLLER